MLNSRLVILLFSLFLAGQAWATVATTGGGGTYGVSAAPSFTGLIDVIATPTALYSLRAGSAAIAAAGTQKLVGVKASGTTPANVTCDILVATSGGMGNTASCSTSSYNGTAAATFCATGAGSCAVCFWYDQSGNGYTMQDISGTCTTAAPGLLFSCIGSLPCLTFNGTAQAFENNVSFPGNTQPFSVTNVAERTGATTSYGCILCYNNATETFFNNTTNTAGFYAGGSIITKTANDSAWHALQSTFNGTSGATNVDGTDSTSQNMGTGVLGSGTFVIQIGANGLGSVLLTGRLTEIGVWAGAWTSTQRGNMCHNEFAYWGTSTSC